MLLILPTLAFPGLEVWFSKVEFFCQGTYIDSHWEKVMATVWELQNPHTKEPTERTGINILAGQSLCLSGRGRISTQQKWGGTCLASKKSTLRPLGTPLLNLEVHQAQPEESMAIKGLGMMVWVMPPFQPFFLSFFSIIHWLENKAETPRCGFQGPHGLAPDYVSGHILYHSALQTLCCGHTGRLELS